MGVRVNHILRAGLLLFALAHAAVSPIVAEDPRNTAVNEAKARQNLAQKLLTLSQSLDMREGSYPDSRAGGKDYNNNDGNSFQSNTTYHSNVWDYCLNWVGGKNCSDWLDPYVSPHGAQRDRSPLEGAVYDEWRRRKQPMDPGQEPPQPQGAQVQYAIWDIKRDPAQGDLIERDGRLNKKGIIDMRLQQPIKQKVEQVGTDTAQRQINLTYDANSGTEGAGTIMPNMEGLRMMAGRWTKMFRNRLVSNIGELRASDVPIEVALGEDYSECNSYARALENEFDRNDEKRRPQQPLDPETKNAGLQRRLQFCREMKNLPVQNVNPEVDAGGQRVNPEGDRNLEAVDKWRARVNIALIDSAGRDPNSIPKPDNAPIERYEYENDIPDYDAGGRNRIVRRATNADQLAGYNRNLQDAAVGMKEVAARSNIRDNSAEVLQYQIQPMTRNVVEVNGLTPEMRGELAGTNFAQTASGAIDPARRPEKRLEQTPAELTIRRLQ